MARALVLSPAAPDVVAAARREGVGHDAGIDREAHHGALVVVRGHCRGHVRRHLDTGGKAVGHAGGARGVRGAHHEEILAARGGGAQGIAGALQLVHVVGEAGGHRVELLHVPGVVGVPEARSPPICPLTMEPEMSTVGFRLEAMPAKGTRFGGDVLGEVVGGVAHHQRRDTAVQGDVHVVVGIRVGLDAHQLAQLVRELLALFDGAVVAGLGALAADLLVEGGDLLGERVHLGDQGGDLLVGAALGGLQGLVVGLQVGQEGLGRTDDVGAQGGVLGLGRHLPGCW